MRIEALLAKCGRTSPTHDEITDLILVAVDQCTQASHGRATDDDVASWVASALLATYSLTHRDEVDRRMGAGR